MEPPDTTAALHADALTVPRAAETLDAAVEPRNDDDDRARIVPGTRLDRYYVTGLLGRGGMGEVYRGYDPELDRHLAIKLIRAGTSSATSRAALAREARSLAKLSHPNVVAIYDVGTHDDELFIAMELVDGVDLATWCTRTRTLAEIRSVFAAAGRGLAAAHGAGLVHRDFKPANVLVGADATIVRVGDFGLARSDRGGVVGRTSDSGRDCESLTATGFVAGTPAYMAPEVHAGIGADARSDQYAFFIALYEALFGVRPFLGDGLEALLRAKRASDVVFPERKPIPGWLRAAIVRGLAVDPQARWPSMDAVVDELERHRSRRWLRDVVLGGVAVGSVALVIASNREPTEPGRCDHVDDLVAAAWGDAQRSQVDRALRAVGGAHGEETATRVGAAIDRWVDTWRAAYVATCVASPEVGVVAWQQLDPKTRCLRHELFELEALVGSFGDLAATERAVAAVDDLATPDACGRAATGRGVPEPPVELLDAVEDARVELDRVEATIAVGRYAEAVDRLDELAPRVDEIGFAPLRVELDDLRTMAIVELTPADDTEARIFHNVWEAEASGYDVLALEGLRRAIHYITARQREPERGEQWLPLAEAMARRTGDDAQEARTLALRGVVQTNLRRFDDADRSLREAIRRLEAGGHSSYQAQMQLAYALMRSDRVVEAIEIIERVLEAETERLGAHHPVIANRLAMLATAQLELGRNRDAERALQRSAAILAEVRGTHHTQWYLTMNNLGVAAERDHRYDEAHAYYQRALDEIPEGSVAFRLEASMITHNLAYLERTAGRLDRALALERRAYALAVGHDPELESLPAVVLTIATIAYECGAPEIARREHARVKALDDWADSAPTMLDELVFDEALVAWSEGDRAQAIAQCERADELFAQHAREADLELHVGVVLTCAELLREDGRCADALVHARRAVARAAEPPGEPARGVAAVELAEARACADGETRSADEIARARLLAAEYWWAESDLHRARRWARGDAAWLAAHEIRCPSRDELNADLPAPPDAAAP